MLGFIPRKATAKDRRSSPRSAANAWVFRSARPVRGLGIATPMFIPPIVAVLTTWLLAAIIGGPQHNDAIAYVGGVMGTLIGADLLNLNKLGDLGAPVASIGGAGTFDGVFLTGIVAVLLA